MQDKALKHAISMGWSWLVLTIGCAISSEAATFSWLPLISLSIFFIAFSIGYDPIVWVMISEVYSKQLSGFISPFTGFYNWMFAFIITLTFRPIADLISTGPTFWIFSGASFIGILFTFFVIPETKGKSMSDIQRLLSGEKNIQKS
ncbi:hypothetical protein PVAND_013395 [Polypedilum vanderplanki]|uniref:Major facilitator superfamily (MFS) profile domain-containing protein n=1 Tax=Polypedilum vanderplanki TaxID=319348 RepID=A0A9J6CPC4_POLVA|nr:hypothetical protein PVAND_013395 [Polypedilum vanderplanki]